MTALTLGHEFFFAEWSVWRKYFNFTWSPFQIIIGGHFTLEQVNIAAIGVVPTPIISKDSELVDPNWVSGWATQITVSLLNELTSAQWKLNNKWGRTFYISKILHKIYIAWVQICSICHKLQICGKSLKEILVKFTSYKRYDAEIYIFTAYNQRKCRVLYWVSQNLA